MKFKEYISIIGRGIANFDKVAEGWLKDIQMEYGNLPDDQIREIIRRRTICHSCPLMSLNIVKDDTEYKKLFNEPFELDKSRSEYCGSCLCPIKTRTSSLSSNCGLEYYNQNNPNNIQNLKWEKYNEKTNNS